MLQVISVLFLFSFRLLSSALSSDDRNQSKSKPEWIEDYDQKSNIRQGQRSTLQISFRNRFSLQSAWHWQTNDDEQISGLRRMKRNEDTSRARSIGRMCPRFNLKWMGPQCATVSRAWWLERGKRKAHLHIWRRTQWQTNLGDIRTEQRLISRK